MPRAAKPPRPTPAVRKLREALAELVALADERVTAAGVLSALNRTFRTLGRSLLWLAAYERDEVLQAHAERLLLLALQEPGLSKKVREKVVRQAAELAETVIRDPHLADERKLVVSTVLSHSGRDLDPDELAECFVDFQGTLERIVCEAGSSLLDGAEQIDSWLQATEATGAFTADEPSADELAHTLGLAALLGQANPRVGATALAAVAAICHATPREPIQAELSRALEASAKLDPERALALLAELSTWPNTGSFGAKARELSMRLRAAGVTPRPLPAGPFSHGLVSLVDGSGSRALQLQYHQGEGALDAVCLMLNDRVGLKDAWCAFSAGHEAEERFRSSGIPLASCSEDHARALIADALATNEASGRAVPGRWLLYRAYLSTGPLEPARRTPNLSAYLLETVVRNSELGTGSEALLDAPAYDQLGFDSEAAYAFVSERSRGRRGELRITPELVRGFLDEVEPHERERLARRLAVNLEHEARAGRAKQRLNRLAARTWIALSEGLCPFHELPYARALAAHSLSAIAHNLALGHASQDKANEASLQAELDLEDLAFEFAGLADV